MWYILTIINSQLNFIDFTKKIKYNLFIIKFYLGIFFMDFIYGLIGLGVVCLIIYLIIKKFKPKNKKNYKNQPSQTKYQSKQLMSEYEKYFYEILSKNLAQDYIIMPQVNLASIIEKIKDFPKQYQNELYRNIDFGIFNKTTMKPLLLIEINDKTHNQPDRIKRDLKVKEICNQANIKLITFYTKYDNKPNYIISRVKKELEE